MLCRKPCLQLQREERDRPAGAGGGRPGGPGAGHRRPREGRRHAAHPGASTLLTSSLSPSGLAILIHVVFGKFCLSKHVKLLAIKTTSVHNTLIMTQVDDYTVDFEGIYFREKKLLSWNECCDP